MGNAVDINNLRQALNENNIYLMDKISKQTPPNIKISDESSNALSLKDDGLYLSDIGSTLDEIENLINTTNFGYAEGSYSNGYITDETKVSRTIAIPINLNFLPKVVFVGFNNINCGTNNAYRTLARGYVYVSSLDTPLELYYDSNVSSTTSYTIKKVSIYIKNFSQESITLLIEGGHETSSTSLTGTDANTYVTCNLNSWCAIG